MKGNFYRQYLRSEKNIWKRILREILQGLANPIRHQYRQLRYNTVVGTLAFQIANLFVRAHTWCCPGNAKSSHRRL